MPFAGGARGLYVVSHATESLQEPLFEYQFERGTVYYNEMPEGKVIRAVFSDGTEKVYGNPFANPANKLWRAADAVKDPSLRPVCGIGTAAPHTRTIARVQEFGVRDFPAESIRTLADGSGLYVADLDTQLRAAYENAEMWNGLR